MDTISKALTHLEQSELAEVFENLDQIPQVHNFGYARLKREFVHQGAKDLDFYDRLKVFIQNINTKDSTQTSKILKTLESIAKASQMGFEKTKMVLQGKECITIVNEDEARAKHRDFKTQVAFIIEFARPLYGDVSHFLEQKGIDATTFYIKNLKDQLNPENQSQWTNLVKEINRLINSSKQTLNNPEIHIFVSAPATLAFGIGVALGTYSGANLYHFQNNTYHKVLQLEQGLRM